MVDTPLSSLVKVAPLLDEDDMVSDSAAHGATQQSIKAYHDAHGFVDRGDPAAHDFLVGYFTTDFTWREFDLSGIVPAGAKAVGLAVIVQDNLIGQQFQVRQNGNANVYNVSRTRTQVANIVNDIVMFVPCDSDRKCEYRASNTTFTLISVTVVGWWF